MKEIADAYREIWARKLVGQKPPDQHSIDRVTWTDGLVPKASPNDCLVDLGTGSGAMLGRGRAKGYQVIGTDIDKELVEWLKSTGFPAQVEDLNVDLSNFKTDRFAVVTSCDVIEHLWNPNQMLREAFRILRPGGKVYIGTPNCAFWRRVASLALGTMFRTSGDPELKDGGHLAYYGPADLHGTMKDVGFVDVKAHFFKHEPINPDVMTAFRILGSNRHWAEHAYMIMEATK